MSIALEEADENVLWLKLSVKVGLAKQDDVQQLAQEADEIVESSSPAEAQCAPSSRKPTRINSHLSIVNASLQSSRYRFVIPP
jgi:hypothetical protein